MKLGVSPDIHECQWRARLDEGRAPDTHLLGERLADDGVDGVIYPSIMSPGGTCIALWRWNETDGPTLEIIDPDHRLPKTPASWL